MGVLEKLAHQRTVSDSLWLDISVCLVGKVIGNEFSEKQGSKQSCNCQDKKFVLYPVKTYVSKGVTNGLVSKSSQNEAFQRVWPGRNTFEVLKVLIQSQLLL